MSIGILIGTGFPSSDQIDRSEIYVSESTLRRAKELQEMPAKRVAQIISAYVIKECGGDHEDYQKRKLTPPTCKDKACNAVCFHPELNKIYDTLAVFCLYLFGIGALCLEETKRHLSNIYFLKMEFMRVDRVIPEMYRHARRPGGGDIRKNVKGVREEVVEIQKTKGEIFEEIRTRLLTVFESHRTIEPIPVEKIA